jgi:DNA processing protein
MSTIVHWIALKSIRGIGEVTYKNLISRYSDPQKVFSADHKDLLRIEGLRPDSANLIKAFDDWETAKEEADKLEKLGLDLLVLSDPDYPKNLYNTYNPPPYLYVRGRLTEQDNRAIAIVGSRTPDIYGKRVTEQIAGELARNGNTIVSGLAKGIDTIAHRACLKAGGRTIAVLGSGIDLIYPYENRSLSYEMSQNGAVVSEFKIGTIPEAVNFPRRNRIISGLSLGVLVVQATEKSGSLITADFALEQNREVFAIPGNIESKLSKGTNKLIKRGAKLVNDIDDILEEIDGFMNTNNKKRVSNIIQIDELESAERLIYEILSDDQLHIDQIIKRSNLDTSEVLTNLLSLEIKGIVSQLPGKYFQIVS